MQLSTKGLSTLQSQVDDTSAAVTIESGDQRLRISPEGTPLTYQNFLRVGNGTSNDWKPATLAGVPLVTGASFQLVTSRVRREGLRVRCEGNAEAEGLDGKPLKYDWDAEIETAAGAEHARSLDPLPHNASSPGAAAIAAEKLYRASNHHLAEFHFHLDGRPIGKLAARAAGTAYAELAGHLRQRSSRRLSSGPDGWRRDPDVLRCERYGLDVHGKSSALSGLSLLQRFAHRA